MPIFDESESSFRQAISCLALLFFAGIVLIGPMLASLLYGPWVALLAACGCLAIWMWLGPPPRPGLLQGILAMAVLFNSLAWVAISLFQIIRSWLNA